MCSTVAEGQRILALVFCAWFLSLHPCMWTLFQSFLTVPFSSTFLLLSSHSRWRFLLPLLPYPLPTSTIATTTPSPALPLPLSATAFAMAERLPSFDENFREKNDSSHLPLLRDDQRIDIDPSRPPASSAPALTPLPFDRLGLGVDGNAYLPTERVSTRRNVSERSSLVAGMFGSSANPLGFHGVLEDSTHPSPNYSNKRERPLDMGISQLSRPYGGAGGSSGGGTAPSVLHGPTQSDFSALWKSIADKPPSTMTQSAHRPPPPQPQPQQPLLAQPPRTNPSPTASLYQGPVAPPSPTVSSLLAAAATQPTEQRASPSNAPLPLSLDANRGATIPAASTPIVQHVPTASVPLGTPTQTGTPNTRALGLNPKSNVLPFVMASGIFDYGLGSDGGATKSGMVSYPTPTTTPVTAGSSLQHAMTAQNHLDWMPQSSPLRSNALPTPPRYIGSSSGIPPNTTHRQVFIPPQSIGPSIPVASNVHPTASTTPAVQRQDDLHALIMRSASSGTTAHLPVDLVVKSEALVSDIPSANVSGLWPTSTFPTTPAAVPFTLQPDVSSRLAAAGPSSSMQRLGPTGTTLKRSRASVEDEDDQLKEQCPLCPVRARSRAVLQSHLRTVHKTGSEHRCNECGAEFPWKSTLDNHVRLVHRKERPFKCQLCDKAFRWSSHLEEHVWVVHEGRKPFKCEVCNKAFGRKNNMLKHARRHNLGWQLVHQIASAHTTTIAYLQYSTLLLH